MYFFSFILEGRLFSIYGLWVWLLFVGKMYRKLVCIYRCSKNYLQNNRKVCVGIIIDKIKRPRALQEVHAVFL